MDEQFSAGICHQGNCVLCIKYRGDSSVHGAVKSSFGRKNGCALAKDTVCEGGVRYFGEFDQFSVHGRAYSHIRQSSFRGGVRIVVFYGNFYRIIKADDLDQDNCQDTGNGSTDQYADDRTGVVAGSSERFTVCSGCLIVDGVGDGQNPVSPA